MKSLLVSIPCEVNGSINAHLADWLLRVVVEPVRLGVDIVRWDIVQDKPTAQTRNRQVKRFLEGDLDLVLFLDSDMVPDDDSIRSLVYFSDREDIDVISGIADRWHHAGPMPVILKYSPDGKRSTLHNEILTRDPDKGPYELVGAGTGAAILLCKRAALEKVRDEGRVWFYDVIETDVNDDKFGHRVTGHDSWFFIQCQECGVRTWVDTTAYIGHMKQSDLSHEAARFHRERLAREQAEQENEQLKEQAEERDRPRILTLP